MDDYQFGYITKLENIKKKLLGQFRSLFIINTENSTCQLVREGEKKEKN
jgi:hypothetical protein